MAKKIQIHNVNHYKDNLISGESILMLTKQNIENVTLSADKFFEISKSTDILVGTRKVVAIRVDANDASTTMTKKQLRNRLFGRSSKKISLKSQYSKCSFNQLTFYPFNGKTSTNAAIIKGVGEVSIPINVINAAKGAVTKAVDQAVDQKYGKVRNLVHHYIYCLPPGTGDWVASGTVNGKMSVFNDEWCDNIPALMHEIGHNLKLGHSGEGNMDYAIIGEGNAHYSDESCIMGFSSYNLDITEEGVEIQKCFNGAKSWQLGWYAKGHAVVNEDSPIFEGNLIGIIYYSQLKSDKVIVKIVGRKLDYYVAFNHKASFNSMAIEGQDLVLVTSREPKNGAVGSRLVAKLDEGDSYIVDGIYNIEVEEIDKSSKRYLAKVKIGVQSCITDSDCDDGNACTVNNCSDKGFCVTNQDCFQCNEIPIEVDVMTDNYPNETSWEIIDLTDNRVIQNNDPIVHKFTQYRKLFCLESGNYSFIMNKPGKETLQKNREGYYALVVDGQVMKNDVLISGTRDTKQFSIL